MTESKLNGFQGLWKDSVSGSALRITIVIFFSLVAFIAFFFWRLPPEIPLAYSRPWGMAQLVAPYFLFVLLFISAGFVVINTFLASILFEAHQLLARIILWSTFLTALIINIAVMKIILLVI